MDINKLQNADFLDILFENRNKEYGAYELRKTYNRRIIIAISGMMLVCLLFLLSQILASKGDTDTDKIIVQDVQLEDIKVEEKKPEPPPPPPPPKPEPPKVEITKFTPPKIVKDVEVKEPPPPQEKLEETKIGVINQEGLKDEGFVAPPAEVGTGVVEAPKKVEEDYDKVFTKVEKEAKFPGGPDGWRKYLERNLDANVAANDGAPTGNYTVKVQFIVDKTGAISNVKAIEVPQTCPSCGPEAVKVITKGPKWEPAVQNGRNVIYQAIQFVTFQVAEE
jgi:periplasmic protein TonB